LFFFVSVHRVVTPFSLVGLLTVDLNIPRTSASGPSANRSKYLATARHLGIGCALVRDILCPSRFGKVDPLRDKENDRSAYTPVAK